MKKLLASFCLFIFLYACSSDSKSDNVIDKDEMYKVLLDIHLADASLDYASNSDSILINAKAKYDYIFKKHGIDSASFELSLASYTKNKPKDMLAIYKNVVDSLDRFRDKLAIRYEPFQVPVHVIYPDTIYYHANLPFKIDSNLLKNKKKEPVIKSDTLNQIKPKLASDTVKILRGLKKKR